MDIIEEIKQHPQCVKKVYISNIVKKEYMNMYTLDQVKKTLVDEIIFELLSSNIIQVETSQLKDGDTKVFARVFVIDENKLNTLKNNM